MAGEPAQTASNPHKSGSPAASRAAAPDHAIEMWWSATVLRTPNPWVTAVTYGRNGGVSHRGTTSGEGATGRQHWAPHTTPPAPLRKARGARPRPCPSEATALNRQQVGAGARAPQSPCQRARSPVHPAPRADSLTTHAGVYRAPQTPRVGYPASPPRNNPYLSSKHRNAPGEGGEVRAGGGGGRKGGGVRRGLTAAVVLRRRPATGAPRLVAPPLPAPPRPMGEQETRRHGRPNTAAWRGEELLQRYGLRDALSPRDREAHVTQCRVFRRPVAE